jgi:hypothetical protein
MSLLDERVVLRRMCQVSLCGRSVAPFLTAVSLQILRDRSSLEHPPKEQGPQASSKGTQDPRIHYRGVGMGRDNGKDRINAEINAQVGNKAGEPSDAKMATDA